VLAADHGRLLANAVRWAANEPQPLTVDGPGLVDIALWRQASSLTAHIVNLTNPYAMKGPMREVLPVGPQTVRVRCPRPKRARWLVAGTQAGIRYAGGQAEAVTPPVGLHEVLALDF
jgi:hypothetical protein